MPYGPRCSSTCLDRTAEVLQYEGIRQALQAADEADAAFRPSQAAVWRSLAEQMRTTRDVYAGTAGLEAR